MTSIMLVFARSQAPAADLRELEGRHILHALVAATAKARGLMLVTRNLADLARGDLRVLNPFDPPGHGK